MYSSIQIFGWVSNLNGGAAVIGSRGRSYRPRDNLSQSKHIKMRLYGVMPHKRTKQYVHLYIGKFHIHGRTDPEGALRFF